MGSDKYPFLHAFRPTGKEQNRLERYPEQKDSGVMPVVGGHIA